MKRALAERAKQSGLPNGVGPSIPGSETTSSPPPSSHPEHSSNVPKDLETPPSFLTTIDEIPNKNVLSIATKSNGPSVSSSVPSPRTTSSPRPKKRLRDSIVKLDDPDEEDSNASAFFLRHQNRALASELRQLKYQIIRLERERDTRRSQCALAVLNLNTLHATWTQLEEALHDGQSFVVPTADESGHEGGSSTSAAPLSTGSGTSVELVGALFHSLAALGNPANGGTTKKIENGDDMDVDEESDDDRPHMEEPLPECLEEDTVAPIHVKQLDELLHVTDNVAKRASVLQGWIWSLLHRLENGASKSVDVAEQIHAAQLQVAHLKAKNKILKAKMKELSRSRDELQLSDKRVRRGLYRLAAGRDQLKDVLKAIVASDEDKESATEWIGSSLPTLEFPGGGNAELAESTSAKTEESTGDRKESTPISAAELAQFQKKVMELEQIATARDEQIKTLLAEREEQTKKITSLIFASNGKSAIAPTDEVMKKSDLYAEWSTKLTSAQRIAKEMEESQQRIKEEWGQAIATADSAKKAMEELHSKQVKRWIDLVEEFPELASSGEGETGTEESENNITKAKEVVILQHKLTQALENVRQAEATRKTLHEAVIMNETLQSKLEEIKAKYTALQQSRSNGTSNNSIAASVTADPTVTPKAKPPTATGVSSEKPEKSERADKSEKSSDKFHREYRRIQKQLAAATASKESAKAKLERAEKDRDSLNSANSRLLKQAAEKDEMNAKSLSTILHLKQLTDQITKEKENLEQQVKSSQQLALSARLAANARERLSEEIDKERQMMESRVKEWEEKCRSLAQEKEQIEVKMTQSRSRTADLLKEAEIAKGRCDELACGSTKLQEEKQKLMESVAIAQKEAEEAHKLTERLAKSSGGAIAQGFTADQLHTQVKHLQSRVNCPVCNVRDKKCILLRCRHMFCKNCVEENIKNRSRKCPACGIRFDTKDVGDIWL